MESSKCGSCGNLVKLPRLVIHTRPSAIAGSNRVLHPCPALSPRKSKCLTQTDEKQVKIIISILHKGKLKQGSIVYTRKTATEYWLEHPDISKTAVTASFQCSAISGSGHPEPGQTPRPPDPQNCALSIEGGQL